LNLPLAFVAFGTSCMPTHLVSMARSRTYAHPKTPAKMHAATNQKKQQALAIFVDMRMD
jgi:hypothetical protein